MTKLYIAGGIAGVEHARSNFAAAATFLRQHDYDAVNPFTIAKCDGVPQLESKISHTWECCIRHDLIVMLSCDGVALLPNWYSSRGAMWEAEIAKKVGMKVAPYHNWISVRPPEGWYTFGEHADKNIDLEFSLQTDTAGLPLWERPVHYHG